MATIGMAANAANAVAAMRSNNEEVSANPEAPIILADALKSGSDGHPLSPARVATGAPRRHLRARGHPRKAHQSVSAVLPPLHQWPLQQCDTRLAQTSAAGALANVQQHPQGDVRGGETWLNGIGASNRAMLQRVTAHESIYYRLAELRGPRRLVIEVTADDNVGLLIKPAGVLDPPWAVQTPKGKEFEAVGVREALHPTCTGWLYRYEMNLVKSSK
ncbi:hypothetical protein LTS10_000190 [Elasticomyces elasticus]|nr:hypothetical protein LTS10_000190 [Elasticomyces elasticus]